MSQAQYVTLVGLMASGRSRLLRRIVGVAGGVACLFSPYTLLLGVVVLVSIAIASIVPHCLPGTAARTYREMTYLHGPVTYGVDHERLWARAAGLSAEVTWRHLTVWQERGGWLIFRGNGFPLMLFPVDGLTAAGLYDIVRGIAARHCAEFGGRRTSRSRLTKRFSGPTTPAAEH